mmetsp:Transcript_94592/g.168065  ORF Transcript_94592/g.168065 Transcript_94592/m.168065 type:complete len:251 (+) Transcript_94592:582-1334(+)
MPWAASRPNSDKESPRVSASSEQTLGGNWQWSPTRTRRSAPLRMMGTMAESSVACATSSIKMALNLRRFKKSEPEAIVVVQITSAPFRMLILASNSSTLCCFKTAASFEPLPPPLPRPFSCRFSSLLPPSSCCRLRMDSKVMSSRLDVTFSGRPTRTTFRLSWWRPSAMLSTAMLLSEVASSGFTPLLAQLARRRTETVVFPVPGGPCTSVSRRPAAAATAEHCEGLSSLSTPFAKRFLTSLISFHIRGS